MDAPEVSRIERKKALARSSGDHRLYLVEAHDSAGDLARGVRVQHEKLAEVRVRVTQQFQPVLLGTGKRHPSQR